MKTIAILLAAHLCGSHTLPEDTTIRLDEVVVSSFYQHTTSKSNVVNAERIALTNYGQEPSNVFTTMPSVISLNDNGTEFGYGYFRIRGLDQTRINVTLDGCPWNEAEDYGSYFANSPDLMSSMHTVRVERGSSSSYNGIAGVAGGIMLESANLYKDTTSYAYLGGGSFGSFKSSVVYNMGERNGWGLHIKATHQQTDGYRDFGMNSSQAFTVKTGYRFNHRHSLDFLSMNGYHRNGQGWIGNSLEELQANPSANGCTREEDDNWFMSMNRLQYKGWLADNTLLTSSVFFQYQDGSYRFDLDNYMRRMADPEWQTTGALYDYGLRHTMIGANVAAKQYLSDLTLTAGANAYIYRRKHFMDDGCRNVSAEEYYDNEGTKKDMNAFFMASWKVTNRLSLSGNVQYRHVVFDYEDYKNKAVGFDPDALGTVWDFVNFGANVEYTPTKVLKLYTAFNYVNREPTRSDMFGGNENYIGELATIRSEKAKDWELGVVYSPSNRLNVEANLFYMWFDNELVLNGAYGMNGLPCHDNADSSYRRGVELSAAWSAVSKLHLTATAAFSQNRLETGTYGTKNHILSPSTTLYAELAWKEDQWEVGVNANYHSRMYTDMENRHEVPALFSLNAYGNVRLGDVVLSLRVNNLTDRVNYCTGAVGANDRTLYVRNAPINFNGSIQYFF